MPSGTALTKELEPLPPLWSRPESGPGSAAADEWSISGFDLENEAPQDTYYGDSRTSLPGWQEPQQQNLKVTEHLNEEDLPEEQGIFELEL